VPDAFEAYAPLGVPKAVAPDLWIVDGPEILFGYLGIRLPFPTRMTVVRIDGGLWLHSPIALTDPLCEALAVLGPVRFLIAPNTLHYWWIADWKRRFPDAVVHAVPGLAERAKRPVPIDHVLGDQPPPDWAGTIDQAVVLGSLLNEVAFFHRPSRSLILTDLIENFEPARTRRWWLRWLLRLSGAADPDGKAPFDMQFTFRRQKSALRAAVERMIGWNPERIILAHGRWYERDGVAELKRAFRWVF
jgi:hypothetical protein